MTTLYVATTNAGKLRDFAVAALPVNISLLPLPDLDAIAAPPEDQPTFAGNAVAKAIYYSLHQPGALVIADDSGLEVDGLNGEPGVFSARYASIKGFVAKKPQIPQRTDGVPEAVLTQDDLNNACLLAHLQHVPANLRSARYVCSLAAAKNGECLFTSEGAVGGEILRAPQGSGGFGYDPLFYLPRLGKTMAELSAETKHLYSHRGAAIRSLLFQLHDKVG